MIGNEFYALLASRGLVLSDDQKDQFHRFYLLLVDWNERMNLTGITEESEVYAKHFYDSLDPFLEMEWLGIKTVCDVGTGAGFPGIPLAIAYPEVQFDLIDSLGKRIEFLNVCIEELGLAHVKAIHIRAEAFAEEKREYFDLVTSRAVAKLSMLVELCAPLVKVDGCFVTLKGPAGHVELKAAKQGPSRLGLTHEKTTDSSIEGIGDRVNIYFKKMALTPKKYPRQFGQIKNRPLI
ncbi:MAG: 16S rRNA (guanine(527)-N(7))-methyltransferase RsmG [Defluviitaleaceae bacterium]|nr:16S rRNA (guanine(527)-N(7))-methyltransferase RsmG [Defluviitaleaceae bacterium]